MVDGKSDGRRLNLSSEYYTHKRTVLLCSSALFILSLPGVSISTWKYADFALNGVEGGFLLFALAAVTAYYARSYYAIWRYEASAYFREQRSGKTELLAKIEHQLTLLDDAREQTRNALGEANTTLTYMHDAIIRRTGGPSTEDSLDVRDRFLHWIRAGNPDLSDVSYELTMMFSELGKRRPDLNEALGEFKNKILEQARQAAVDIAMKAHGEFSPGDASKALLPTEIDRWKKVLERDVSDANKNFVSSVEEIKELKNDLTGGESRARWRLYIDDGAFPALLCAVAFAHFVGHWFHLGPDLPWLLAHLHLLPPTE